MCTKSKEECEKHYMKHFINNPLFASTLLNLKQVEEAQHSETAIPFHREYHVPADRELPCKVSTPQNWSQQPLEKDGFLLVSAKPVEMVICRNHHSKSLDIHINSKDKLPQSYLTFGSK